MAAAACLEARQVPAAAPAEAAAVGLRRERPCALMVGRQAVEAAGAGHLVGELGAAVPTVAALGVVDAAAAVVAAGAGKAWEGGQRGPLLPPLMRRREAPHCRRVGWHLLLPLRRLLPRVSGALSSCSRPFVGSSEQ